MVTQSEIMREAGYITAAEAAEAIGVAQVGTVHRMVRTGRVSGLQAAKHWYVNVKSLIEAYKEAPPIVEKIRALGVTEKDPQPIKPRKGLLR